MGEEPTKTGDDKGTKADPPAQPAPPAPDDNSGDKGGKDEPTSNFDPKILEDPALWQHPRIAELRQQAARAKELEKAQADAEEKALKDQKKFEELAEKRASELEQARKENEKLRIDTALTAKLATAKVVDADAALQLVDRSKLSIKEDGTVEGVDAAIESLQSERGYLFTNQGATPQAVGSPTNAGQGQGNSPAPGQKTFKRSQLTSEFMEAHRDEVYDAMQKGLIEDDGPPPS